MSPHGRAGVRGCRPWTRETRSALLLLVAILLVAGLAISPTNAADPSRHSTHHGSLAVSTGALLLALAGLGYSAAGERRRRATVLLLGLLVGLFGLESAIHSVHHLSDPQAAASCALFSASQHAPGVRAATPDGGAPTWTVQDSATIDSEKIRPLQPFRPHEGRAPPALPSA